jgi:hypothetical protein
MLEAKPENLIGDKAYDSDKLDKSLKERGGSGNLDRVIGDGSALCGDHNAADERSREYETTPP